MNLISIMFGIIAAAVIGVIADWLLKKVLPTKPTTSHIIAGILAIIMLAIFASCAANSNDLAQTNGASQTIPQNEGSFFYPVRVLEKSTNEEIPNAEVTIEVTDKAPLDEITDTKGFARISIPASYVGQAGRLIVSADGYEIHRQEINLTKGILPDTIALELQVTSDPNSLANDSDIRLVDIVVEGKPFPELDIKVRNTGDTIAFLKRAVIHVEDSQWYNIASCGLVSASPALITGEYDVNIRSDEQEFVNLSQSVPSNDIDRFKITVGVPQIKSDQWVLYRIRVELIYNEDDRKVTSEPIVIAIPEGPRDFAWEVVFGNDAINDSSVQDCLQESRQSAKRVIGNNSIKSDTITQLESFIEQFE